MEMPRFAAIDGSIPIGANSVTPMPNAPTASARRAGLKRISTSIIAWDGMAIGGQAV